MNRQQAIALATRQVMGARVDEFVAAQQRFEAGTMNEAAFEPIRDGFRNTLERRRGQIHQAMVEILRGPEQAPQCVAGTRDASGVLVRCAAESTTRIAGKPFCSRHAAFAPRLPVPAGRANS